MKKCRITVKMIIYISISKCRSDSYGPSFHWETFFVHAQNGRKDFFCEASFHYKVYAIHFQCVCDNDRMVFTLICEKLIKLMIYHITISIYVILLIYLTKKNGIDRNLTNVKTWNINIIYCETDFLSSLNI